MALPLWKQNLRPASYNGAPFFVRINMRGGGRRIANHEYPKRDIPYAEDMGRKSRRFTVTGYVLSGPLNIDYTIDRDNLITQLELEGPGNLILPTGIVRAGENQVTIETYSVSENEERGGEAVFEMVFLEFGTNTINVNVIDTQGQVNSNVNNAVGPTTQSTAAQFMGPSGSFSPVASTADITTTFMGSSDITKLQ